jgi:diadenosine tetraphosphatase ApaH/serine/threonine PP2A family protein phosphatase
LLEAGRCRIDKYLCLGDVVGYGADPDACIESVMALDAEMLIAGNHDWGALGRIDLDYFNEYAKEAILWTRDILSRRGLDYLGSFRLVSEGIDFSLVHGSLEEPGEFRYITNPDNAGATISLMKKRLCFVGHTHVAGTFCHNNKIIKYSAQPVIEIERGRKYIVNVGSIGQPRDGDRRASFAVFDTANKSVEIKRVPYDIDTAAKKILKAGLPAMLAERLYEGR